MRMKDLLSGDEDNLCSAWFGLFLSTVVQAKLIDVVILIRVPGYFKSLLVL